MSSQLAIFELTPKIETNSRHSLNIYRMDEIKQKFHSLENAFNRFIKDFGGEFIDEINPQDPNKLKNADYIFRQQNVVAELKRFDKNYYQTNADVERLMKQVEKSIANGYISESELSQYLSKETEPDKITDVILSGVRGTVEDKIRSAEKQIKKIKEVFKMPDAKRLLLLANDKSYFTQLTPLIYIHITEKLLSERPDTPIDGFVYFATNKNYELPTEKENGIIWINNYLRKGQEEFAGFIDKLGISWAEFVCRNTGGTIGRTNHFDEEVINERLESLKVISPD